MFHAKSLEGIIGGLGRSVKCEAVAEICVGTALVAVREIDPFLDSCMTRCFRSFYEAINF